MLFRSREKQLYYTQSTNEILRLYDRLDGLVLVKKKKDCLDLPPKHYKIIRCTPSEKLLAEAKAAIQLCEKTVEALTITRQLSDGFLYTMEEIGEKTCTICSGTGKVDIDLDSVYNGDTPWVDDFEDIECLDYTEDGTCTNCSGTGRVKKDRKSTRLNSSHTDISRMPSSA